MKKLTVLTLFLTLLGLAGGCATGVSNSNFYWGDYSSTLYKLKKNPSNETANNHKKELRRIIQRSLERGIQPPPGLQAELGYMLLNEGKNKLAMNLVKRESRSYPESKVLMKKIYETIKKKDLKK